MKYYVVRFDGKRVRADISKAVYRELPGGWFFGVHFVKAHILTNAI